MNHGIVKWCSVLFLSEMGNLLIFLHINVLKVAEMTARKKLSQLWIQVYKHVRENPTKAQNQTFKCISDYDRNGNM